MDGDVTVPEILAFSLLAQAITLVCFLVQRAKRRRCTAAVMGTVEQTLREEHYSKEDGYSCCCYPSASDTYWGVTYRAKACCASQKPPAKKPGETAQIYVNLYKPKEHLVPDVGDGQGVALPVILGLLLCWSIGYLLTQGLSKWLAR